MGFFHRRYEVDPFPIHDTVVFRNAEETMKMTVKGDPSMIVEDLMKANAKLTTITEATAEEDRKTIAIFFAASMFGKEQAEALLHFYGDDPLPVIAACGKYFRERLGRIITRAQKKG